MTPTPVFRLLLGALALAAVACAAESALPETADAGDDSPVAARIGDATITLDELDDFIKDALLEQQTAGDASALHDLRASHLDNLIGKRLLDAEAARRGVTPDEVLDQEAAKRVSVTDEDVRAFYDENRARIGAEFDDISDQIRGFLERQAGNDAARAFVGELRKQAGVEVLLKTPRVEVATTGSAQGPADARVTVVEFSDYQCPYCQRAEPTIRQVLKQYDGRVRFVYKHFPLESIHPQARGAAEAAGCAEEQGKFWELHELMFAAPAGLEPSALQGYAKQLGLDVDDFTACLGERRHTARIDQDLADGQAAGVNSTPTFFVNGIKLKGAQPFSEFQRVIDAELAKAG